MRARRGLRMGPHQAEPALFTGRMGRTKVMLRRVRCWPAVAVRNASLWPGEWLSERGGAGSPLTRANGYRQPPYYRPTPATPAILNPRDGVQSIVILSQG